MALDTGVTSEMSTEFADRYSDIFMIMLLLADVDHALSQCVF